MPDERQIVWLDSTDENADWIKTEENRKSEAAIHARLAGRGKKDAKTVVRVDRGSEPD